MRPEPVVLELTEARLEPLTSAHAQGLLEAGRDESVWRYLPIAPPSSIDDIRALIGRALSAQDAGAELPFAIIHRTTGRIAGSTRYLDIQPSNRALEIGWTWLGTPWQRTPLNTQCKFLLLRHAFEVLGAVRVQLKTDARNERSRRAIERIGALEEGCLRRSRILHDGFIRDTVCFSVIDAEWPGVKASLEAMIARPTP